ncbi:MAG: hypothetical protein KC478_05485 [Bacteriovoracaceae bacterium]|nr:hypothetical protein [Bacteriovoracaceae bacterium]
MIESSGLNDDNSLETIKNLDFCLRHSRARTVLIGADYPTEGHGGFIHSASEHLSRLYDRKILVVDTQRDIEAKHGTVGRQGIKELEYLFVNGRLDGKKFDIYLEENKKYYDVVFVILDVKRNINTTTLPESHFDGAILVRSNKSITPKASRFVTNTINDSGIKILGTVLQEKVKDAVR